MKKLKLLAILLVIAMTLTSAVLGLNLLSFMTSDTEIIVSQRIVDINSPVVIKVPRINKYDRVYLILNATAIPYSITVNPKCVLIPLPLDVEGVEYDYAYPILMTRHFFFIANASGSAQIILNMQPKTPYAIKDVEGKTRVKVFEYVEGAKEYIGIDIEAVKFAENGYTQTVLATPLNEVIQPDFQVSGEVKLLQGKVSYINLIIMTDTDWYAFNIVPSTVQPNITISFNVNAGSRELLGRTGEFLNKRGLFIALGIGLYSGQFNVSEAARAVVAVGDLTVTNGGRSRVIRAQVFNIYEMTYRLYIFRKFQPTFQHFLLVSALALEVLAFNYVTIKFWKRVKRGGGYIAQAF